MIKLSCTDQQNPLSSFTVQVSTVEQWSQMINLLLGGWPLATQKSWKSPTHSCSVCSSRNDNESPAYTWRKISRVLGKRQTVSSCGTIGTVELRGSQ